MFLTSVLALLQVAFLPGFLVAFGFSLAPGKVKMATLTFLFSALINYFLVTACLLLEIYFASTLLIIIGLELILLILLLQKRGVFTALFNPVSSQTNQVSPGGFTGICHHSKYLLQLPENLRSVLNSAVLIVIIFSLAEVIFRFGDTFRLDDAVNSWNRWAIEMAANHWLKDTVGYPQLLPANYSIFYLLTGNSEIWFFPKVWVSLFFPTLLLSIYSLFREDGSWELALAVVITFILFYLVMLPWFVYGGISDIALATFALSAVLALLRKIKPEPTQRGQKELWTGAALVMATALTKQGGLYILLIYPLLVWRLHISGNDSVIARKQAGMFLKYSIPATWILVGLCYVLYAPHVGSGISAIADDRGILAKAYSLFFNQLHAERGLLTRIGYAWMLLQDRLPFHVVDLIAFFTLISIFAKPWRLILLAIVIPYVLMWALGFSYDHRNIALAIPFIALCFSAGMSLTVKFLLGLFGKAGLKRATLFICIWLASLTLFALYALNTFFDESRLMKFHANQTIYSTGEPTLNQRLDLYFDMNAGPGKIVSTYKTMRWIPALKNRFYSSTQFSRNSPLRKYLDALGDETTGYLLIDKVKTRPDLTSYVQAGLQTGEFGYVFTDSERYVLYRKLTLPQAETMRLAGQAGGGTAKRQH